MAERTKNALLGLAGALAILAAVGAMTWRPILARWFLAQLESADPDRRTSAAEWLGETSEAYPLRVLVKFLRQTRFVPQIERRWLLSPGASRGR